MYVCVCVCVYVCVYIFVCSGNLQCTWYASLIAKLYFPCIFTYFSMFSLDLLVFREFISSHLIKYIQVSNSKFKTNDEASNRDWLEGIAVIGLKLLAWQFKYR